MRRIALACGLGMTLAASGCSGGGAGGGAKAGRGGGQEANRAPKISGHPPPETLAGDYFQFRPHAQDPDDQLLVFSVSNKPTWARLDPASGRLHGYPGAADVGLYTGITISVSDGSAVTSLPAFDIEVTGSADGAATISWTPPTRNEDGSVLHDLAGYRIYVGHGPGLISRVVEIDNPGLTRYLVENLPPATWHFAMTSVNRHGRESRRSAVVSKRVG